MLSNNVFSDGRGFQRASGSREATRSPGWVMIPGMVQTWFCITRTVGLGKSWDTSALAELNTNSVLS